MSQIYHRVGQRLQLGRRSRDLEPAELAYGVIRREHRLSDCAVVYLAVCSKCLGRCRGPDRQLEFGGVRPLPGGGNNLKSGGSGSDCRCWETDLDAIISGNGYGAASAILCARACNGRVSGTGCGMSVAGKGGINGPHRNVDVHWGIGLVLQGYWQLEAISEIK